MSGEKLKSKLLFDIDSAEIVEDNPDSRFITCKLHVFSSGYNHHGLFCSEAILEKTAPTIYNMPIIYSLTKDSTGFDFGSHMDEPEQSLICGFVIPDTATYQDVKDAKGLPAKGLFVQAKIWRIYVPTVYEILEKRDGKVAISVEMWLYDSHIREEDGVEEMDDYSFFGVCLLGKNIKPAIESAELSVLSFSQINEKYKEDYIKEFSKYSSLDFSISEKIRDNSIQGLSLYKKYGIGGNSVALTIGRHLSKNEKAQPEKVKSIYKYLQYHQNDIIKKSPPNSAYIGYLLYGGSEAHTWSKDLTEKMKEIEDKPMSYFEEGEVITFPYKKISESPENVRKLDGVSLTLRQINEIAAQADAIGGDYGWPTAIKSFKNRYHVENGRWVKNKTVKEELSVEDEKELEQEKETMAEEKLPESEQKPEEEKESPKEEADETPNEEIKEGHEEEKMSLDQNLDLAALLAMLVEETDEYKSLVAKYEAGEEMDYALLCGKMFAKMQKMQSDAEAAKEDKDVYMGEIASLKEFKDKIEKQQFDYAVEKTLQEVSDVFSKDELDAAKKETENFTLENLPAWQNSIKSVAFSRIKESPKKKESFTRMATVSSWLNKNNESSEDVSKKYAKEGWLPKN